jgi:hypothetical protein
LADESSLAVMTWAAELLGSGQTPPWLDEAALEAMQEEGRLRSLPTCNEASYLCDACGEEIVIPVDLSAGESQKYVEDCPVCCRPNVIHVEIDEGGFRGLEADPGGAPIHQGLPHGGVAPQGGVEVPEG